MENVYAKSFEKKWYATTPLLALITTQGRCLNPAYAKADQKKTNWSAFCGECYEVMTLLLLIYMMCYMSIPAGKHRSLAPLLFCKINGRPPRLLPLSPYVHFFF